VTGGRPERKETEMLQVGVGANTVKKEKARKPSRHRREKGGSTAHCERGIVQKEKKRGAKKRGQEKQQNGTDQVH